MAPASGLPVGLVLPAARCGTDYLSFYMSDSPPPTSAPQARQEQHRLVTAAQSLYLERGIEAVSAAHVAANARLNPLDVDRYFPGGKLALVQAVVENYVPYVHQTLLQQRETFSTAVEQQLAMRTFMRAEMGQVRTVFFRDLETHYPGSWQYFLQARAAFLLDYTRANLQLGITQALYRDDLDVEFLAQLWLQQISGLLATADTGLEHVDAHYALLNQFLASITTSAGSFVVRRLQEGPPYY